MRKEQVTGIILLLCVCAVDSFAASVGLSIELRPVSKVIAPNEPLVVDVWCAADTNSVVAQYLYAEVDPVISETRWVEKDNGGAAVPASEFQSATFVRLSGDGAGRTVLDDGSRPVRLLGSVWPRTNARKIDRVVCLGLAGRMPPQGKVTVEWAMRIKLAESHALDLKKVDYTFQRYAGSFEVEVRDEKGFDFGVAAVVTDMVVRVDLGHEPVEGQTNSIDVSCDMLNAGQKNWWIAPVPPKAVFNVLNWIPVPGWSEAFTPVTEPSPSSQWQLGGLESGFHLSAGSLQKVQFDLGKVFEFRSYGRYTMLCVIECRLSEPVAEPKLPGRTRVLSRIFRLDVLPVTDGIQELE